MRRKISAVVWGWSEPLRAMAARGLLILTLLVPLGTVGPASATSSASGAEEVLGTQQAAPLKGRVEHLSGRPVADASVRVYHIPSEDFLEGERLATTKTDQQGRYRLTAFAEVDLQSLRERHSGYVLLVAHAPDDGWFQVDLSQSADFFDDRELGTTLLSRQLLLAPTPARLKTKPLGVATVWRHVARGDRTQQTVYVEITDVADAPQRPAYQLEDAGQALTQGAFTAAVPEEGVRVHYDRVDLFRALVGSSPGPLEPGSEEATPVRRWHPTRTELPVYAFTRALETKTFTSYTEKQRRQAERYRSYRRLLIEEIAGAAPFASIGLSFVQVAADLIEESPGPSITVGSGGSPVDLNRQDRVEDGWVGKAHSVVFEVPMTLETGPRASYPVELRATWSEGQAQLAHRVELDVIDEQPEAESAAPAETKVAGGVSMLGGDAARTGVHPGPEVEELSRVRWRFKTGRAAPTSPAVIGGVVYAGGLDGHLYALDAKTGSELWRFDTGGDVDSSPAVADGVVYVGTDEGHLYALDAETGSKLWRFGTDGSHLSSPAVGGDAVYVTSSRSSYSDDRILYAVDSKTGTELWRFKAGNEKHSSPAVTGEVVYVPANDRNVCALDAETGTELWRFDTGPVQATSLAVVKGTVYVTNYTGHLYALDAESGTERWGFEVGRRVEAPLAVAEGIVYVGSYDHHLYAVDAATGEQRWRFKSDDAAVISGPVVVGGVVYVGTGEGHLYALE